MPITGVGAGAEAVEAEYPTRATMWHDESLVTSGAAKATAVSTSQRYNIYTYQDPGADANAFTQSFMCEGGSYTLYLLGMTDHMYGKIDWYIDNVPVIVAQDWYSAATVYNVVKSGGVAVVGDGYHVLKGVVNGKNASADGYYISLTKMWLVPTAD